MRRASRGAGWGLLSIAAVVLMLWGLSYLTMWHVSVGKVTAGVDRGVVEIGRGSVRVGRGPEGWVFPPGVRVVLERPAGWLPTRGGATFWLAQGKGANVAMTLRVMYVRFAFVLPVVAGPGVVLWWLGRRRRARAGCCAGCGYDLSGLGGRGCPECGAAGPVRRLVRRIAGAGRRRPMVVAGC